MVLDGYAARRMIRDGDNARRGAAYIRQYKTAAVHKENPGRRMGEEPEPTRACMGMVAPSEASRNAQPG